MPRCRRASPLLCALGCAAVCEAPSSTPGLCGLRHYHPAFPRSLRAALCVFSALSLLFSCAIAVCALRPLSAALGTGGTLAYPLAPTVTLSEAPNTAALLAADSAIPALTILATRMTTTPPSLLTAANVSLLYGAVVGACPLSFLQSGIGPGGVVMAGATTAPSLPLATLSPPAFT